MIPKKIKEAIQKAPDNVTFAGLRPPQDMLKMAYCGADSFVILSHEETEGIVVLEALAS
jgi:1,2-diacylglycerol-3-alpha-glucose alpha-1,2-glucosyltransferase